MHSKLFLLAAYVVLTILATIHGKHSNASSLEEKPFECRSIEINSGIDTSVSLKSHETPKKTAAIVATDTEYEFTAEICLRFTNNSGEEVNFSLWFDNPRANHIEMLAKENGSPEILSVKGIDYPLKLWRTTGAEIIFEQSLLPGEEKTLHFNVGSVPPYNAQIIIGTTGVLTEKITSQRMAAAILAGIILALVLTCIAIGLSSRDKAYFLISGSTVFVTLLQLSDLGSLFSLWPDSTYWNSVCSGLFASLSTLFGASLARVYLETKSNTPKIDKLLIFFMGYLVLACMPIALLEKDRLFLAVFGGFSVLIFMPAIVVASIIRISQGFPPAKLYLAALAMPYISGLCIFFMYTGTLPSSPLLKTLPLAGTALQLVLFVVALGARINWLQQQRNIAIKNESLSRTETQAKKTFLAHISHELRSPLIGIIGLAELAMKHSLYPSNKILIDGISRSARFLLDTTNTLLDHARVDSGKWVIKTLPFNPEQLINLSLSKSNTLAKEKNLAIKFSAYRSPFENIVADQDIVSRIVDEMIHNGILLAKQGPILVNAEVKQNHAEAFFLNIELVCICDPAINPLELVPFELFQIVDSSTTRQQQGPGLGLSLSQKLCALVRGAIGIDTSLANRTTIWCKIPCTPSDQKAVDRTSQIGIAPAVPQHTSGNRVLLAEDDETLRLIMMSLLDKLEADYTLYPNGKPLVDEYARAHADIGLVVLDWNMPICNASQAIQAIRDFERQAGITPVSIVILTAHDKHSAKEMQFPDDIRMIQKPITLEALRKILPTPESR